MRTVLLILIFISLQLGASPRDDFNQSSNIQWGKGHYIKLDLQISPGLVLLGSFNLTNENKKISIHNRRRDKKSLGDFLVVRDRKSVYILDVKNEKVIGELDLTGLLNYIIIRSDDNGNAKIVYTVTSLPKEGAKHFRPGPPIDYELVYKDGEYVRKN